MDARESISQKRETNLLNACFTISCWAHIIICIQNLRRVCPSVSQILRYPPTRRTTHPSFLLLLSPDTTTGPSLEKKHQHQSDPDFAAPRDSSLPLHPGGHGGEEVSPLSPVDPKLSVQTHVRHLLRRRRHPEPNGGPLGPTKGLGGGQQQQAATAATATTR